MIVNYKQYGSNFVTEHTRMFEKLCKKRIDHSFQSRSRQNVESSLETLKFKKDIKPVAIL